MVLNWHNSRLDLYWIQSGVNLTPEFLQCLYYIIASSIELTLQTWPSAIQTVIILYIYEYSKYYTYIQNSSTDLSLLLSNGSLYPLKS